MNIKQLLLISLFLFIGFVFSANAQSKDSSITWSEVKLSQDKERTLLENSQKDSVKQVLERQSDELFRLKGEATISTQELMDLVKSHKEERLQMLKQYSDERTKLAQIHSEERKAFFQTKSNN